MKLASGSNPISHLPSFPMATLPHLFIHLACNEYQLEWSFIKGCCYHQLFQTIRNYFPCVVPDLELQSVKVQDFIWSWSPSSKLRKFRGQTCFFGKSLKMRVFKEATYYAIKVTAKLCHIYEYISISNSYCFRQNNCFQILFSVTTCCQIRYPPFYSTQVWP